MNFLRATSRINQIGKRTVCSDAIMAKNKVNLFARHEMIRRMGGGQSIRYSHDRIQKEQIDFNDSLKNENWTAVYRYPGVRLAVLLARAKLIQTIASVVYLPYSTYQYMSGIVDSTYFYTCASLAVVAPVMLMIFSRYLNRLIGVIAMNESNELVRIGYLTFWGSRKNIILELSDVLSLSEVGDVREKKMVKFMWFSGGSKFLYLPIKHAEIIDEEKALILFGDLSAFDYKKQ